MKNYTLGIDIGGTNFRIGMVTEDGEIENFEKKSSSVFSTGNAADVLCDEIEQFMERTGSKEKIRAVAVGVPSIVSKDKKTVYSTPNLKGFDNVNFGDALSGRLGIPAFIDRDVNFLLENDIVKLGLDETKTTVGFYIGTGFGNAIFMKGEFYAGKNGAAGELGHIPLFGINERCTCGNIGCSEVRCSGKHLEHLVETHFKGTVIRNVFKEHGDDPIIEQYVRDLAIPIATEINILDPDYIVIAGGVIYMDSFPKDTLLDAIHQYTRKPYPENTLDIRFSKHTQESGVYGSGNYAHAMLKKFNS